ncbi:MAG TPA: chemotaxis protein CheW [Ktedonosporobacter sp.]|nr:chemotaxis protein CheW [Ktedonosporobacter sp.]
MDNHDEIRRFPAPGSAFLNNSQAQFLEQLNDEEFWSYASQIAHSTLIIHPPLENYLACDLQQGSCFIPLAALREIVPPPHRFTLLPSAPPWMIGLTAWRGESIGVIDLGAYLSDRMIQAQGNGMLLIAQADELMLGLYVPVVGSMATLIMERMKSPEQPPEWYVPLCPDVLKGLYDEALVLDISVVLIDVMQRVRITASL